MRFLRTQGIFFVKKPEAALTHQQTPVSDKCYKVEVRVVLELDRRGAGATAVSQKG